MTKPAAPPAQARRRLGPGRGRWPWVLAVALLMAALPLVLIGLIRTETGSRWLLHQLPGLTVERSEGTLGGPRFAAVGLQWTDPIRGHRLQIDRLSWDGAQTRLMPGHGAWLAIHLDELRIGQVRWTHGTPGDRLQPPRSLRTPVALHVARLSIDQVQIDAMAPAQDITARLQLGASDGKEHRLELSRLRWQALEVQGTNVVKADAPHALTLQWTAHSSDGIPWLAQADLQGPLSSPALQIKLGTQPVNGEPGPSLDARVQLRPFESWPLGAVDVTTHQLDLATVVPRAPRTRLSGHATVRSQGLREPVSADIQLDNSVPARVDEGGLPILALKAVVQVNPKQPDQVSIGPFTVEAADTRGAAGRWSGNGSWVGDRLELQTRLVDLQPARLDRRLAAMQLSGPLNVLLKGLPSPDPAHGSQSPWAGPSNLQLSAQAQWDGRAQGAPEAVQLSFAAEADARGVQIRQLQASSGAARAQLEGRLVRGAGVRWQLDSTGELKAFDPRVWFPGSESSWGSGPHVFNGRWDVDLSAPAPTASTRLAQWLPLLLGRADFSLADSRLAGLPLQATLALRQASANAADGLPSRARIDVRLASATLELQGQGNASDTGAQDRTQIALTVPALNELAPLASLRPEWKSWAPQRGELRLQADLNGRWPELNGSIDLQTARLQTGPLTLARGQVTGRVPPERSDGLMLRAELDTLQWHDARLDTLRGQIKGSLERHQLDLELRAPVTPPPALAQTLGWSQSGQARADLVGIGSWSREATDTGLAGRWSAQLERLTVGDARLPTDARGPDASWLAVRGVQIEARTDEHGQLRAIDAKPGEAVSGPLKLRWSQMAWAQPAEGPSTWRWVGDLEPFAVAPLLQRAAGPESTTSPWGGDLRVGASIDLRADQRFTADVRVRRDSGDLVSTDGTTRTPFELEKAEVRWQAQDGLWRFVPSIQGRSFGQLEGELIARAQPAQRWPTRDTPIDGFLNARAASLANWGRWLPSGWMLQGEFDATARLSGIWGAPAYTGSLSGERVAIRNPLQGVDLQDGRLRVRLDGETARIDTLSIRGGDGQLTAQGQARLGARPELTLSAKAERLRVLGRVDRQLVISGQTQLNLSTERLDLQGQVRADSGLFDLSSRDAPALDDDVTVLRTAQATPAAPTRPEPSPWVRQARVALDLDLGPQLRLRGRGLNTGLTGQLRLTTPQGRSLFQGAVQASGGTYAAYGQKLDIERGQISFSGPLDRARLDILALRPNLDMRVGVVISGSALDPRVRLYSDPDMSESDKLSWLVLGRGPEGLGTTDTALLQRAAVALLSGEGDNPSDAALRRLGLDDFSIRQSDGEVRETVVTVGKQLGRRWYVGYERGVNATAGTWQLVYRLAQRFTLRAQSGSDNSLDMIWTWRFGQP